MTGITYEQLLARFAEVAREQAALPQAVRFFIELEQKIDFAWGNLACSTNHQPTMSREDFTDHWVHAIRMGSEALADALRAGGPVES